MKRAAFIPPALLLTWLALVGLTLAFIHIPLAVPPGGDALSYVAKAKALWDMLHQGDFTNPFNVGWSFRPPGTLLMSYPFGFSPDFHWFYFRALFIPIVLLVAAVYVAAPDTKEHPWPTLALALILAGMPILYQFEFNDELRALVSWGVVDNFHAGVAALAMAATLRAARAYARGWALTGVLLAAFCVLIKPAGGLVMIVIALTWVVLLGQSSGWNFRTLRQNNAAWRFTLFGLASGIVIYGLTTLTVFRSQYLSAETLAYGRQAIAILRANDIRSAYDYTGDFLRLSFGYPLVLAILLAFIATIANKTYRHLAVIAALAAATGAIFMSLQADLTQIRYAVVFAAVTLVALVPGATAALARLPRPAALVIGGALALPTLATAALLTTPNAPIKAQAALGINLLPNSYKAEGAQATRFLNDLKAQSMPQPRLYVLGFERPVGAFWMMLEYRMFADETLPRVSYLGDVDWQRASAVRANELLAADYIAFVPVGDSASRAEILSARAVPDFISEQRLVRAWFSTLGEDAGVAPVSETRVRILKVVDREKLQASLAQLDAGHEWPPERPSSLRIWWSGEEVAAQQSRLGAPGIGFHSVKPDNQAEEAPSHIVHGASVSPDLRGLKVRLWIEAGPGPATRQRDVFVHLVDDAGDIVGNAQFQLSDMPPPSPEKGIHLYTAFFPERPASATQVAFGIYRAAAQSPEFLVADGGKRDWDGKRVLFPLP
jgi:hypothetical protein